MLECKASTLNDGSGDDAPLLGFVESMEVDLCEEEPGDIVAVQAVQEANLNNLPMDAVGIVFQSKDILGLIFQFLDEIICNEENDRPKEIICNEGDDQFKDLHQRWWFINVKHSKCFRS